METKRAGVHAAMQEALAAAAFDAAPVALLLVDANLRVLSANQAFAEWACCTVDAAVGQVFARFLSATDAVRMEAAVRRALAGQDAMVDIAAAADPTNIHSAHCRARRGHGALPAVVIAIEPLTEPLSAEIALRESEERLRQITDTIDDMFWLIEVGNPRSMYVSPGFEAIYGRGGDDIGGSPEAWLEWVHSDDRGRMRGHFEALAQGVGYAEEYRIVRPDGAVRWVLEKAHRVSTARAGVVLIAGLTSDVTDRRRLTELKRLKEEAETANRTKSEFLSKMSHELRTPLNAVLGFAQLLQFDTTRPLDGAQRDSVEEIIGAGRHLLAIVDEMLDLTRIEMGKLRISYEAVALGDVIAECVSMVQTQAQLRAISLNSYTWRPGCRPLVYADRTRVRQILLNLLSNAIKYNVQGGQVDIVFDKVADGRVRLTVQDTGLGLDQAQIEQLFVPFQRLDAERIACEGLGLGLALSKQLAEAMGGAIGAEGERGRGCAFWLELPLAPGLVPE
ncbi:MAG: ATP-binding protein [Gammaproteobacteria bacterium]